MPVIDVGMVMRMSVRIRMVVTMIGTSLGFEGCRHGSDGEPESSHHFVKDMVGFVPQPSLSDLKRNVSIPEVITGSREQQGVFGPSIREQFEGGSDDDVRTIATLKLIPIDDRGSRRQEKASLPATFQYDALTRSLAQGVREDQVIVGFDRDLVHWNARSEFEHVGP